MPVVQKIDLVSVDAAALRAEARRAGFAFIEKLVTDWESGANRFDGPGEMLAGCVEGGQLIAVGGLNRDPYLGDPRAGRLRRVYVREAWRNQKLGTTLVLWLLDAARGSFEAVRLRAENPGAARLYERLGFTRIDDRNATHLLRLKESEDAGAAAAGTLPARRA
jgi:GNAT superfamily N-acetyltransferase